MTMTPEQTVAIVAAFSAITTAIFWGSFLLGRLHSRMESSDKKLEGIEHTLDRAGQKMSDLADDVQKMPDKFLTRQEAMLWRGSRSEDPRG